MITSTMCSWCHRMNPIHQHWCQHCLHAAHLARLDCDCRKCVGIHSSQTADQVEDVVKAVLTRIANRVDRATEGGAA